MFENEWVQRVLLWAGGLTTAAFGWFAKRQLDRIDRLEATSITRPEFIRALDALEKKNELMHGQNLSVLTQINSRVDAILLHLTPSNNGDKQ